jgi:hypothetical protein
MDFMVAAIIILFAFPRDEDHIIERPGVGKDIVEDMFIFFQCNGGGHMQLSNSYQSSS